MNKKTSLLKKKKKKKRRKRKDETSVIQMFWNPLTNLLTVFVNIPIKNSAKYGPQIIPDSFMTIWNKSKPKVVHNVYWKNIMQV